MENNIKTEIKRITKELNSTGEFEYAYIDIEMSYENIRIDHTIYISEKDYNEIMNCRQMIFRAFENLAN